MYIWMNIFIHKRQPSWAKWHGSQQTVIITFPVNSWDFDEWGILAHTNICIYIIEVLCAQLLSHLQPFATTKPVASQTDLSMGFSRQEYWSGLPFPTPRDLPDPGIEPMSLVSPALAGRFFTTSTSWEAIDTIHKIDNKWEPTVYHRKLLSALWWPR